MCPAVVDVVDGPRGRRLSSSSSQCDVGRSSWQQAAGDDRRRRYCSVIIASNIAPVGQPLTDHSRRRRLGHVRRRREPAAVGPSLAGDRKHRAPRLTASTAATRQLQHASSLADVRSGRHRGTAGLWHSRKHSVRRFV